MSASAFAAFELRKTPGTASESMVRALSRRVRAVVNVELTRTLDEVGVDALSTPRAESEAPGAWPTSLPSGPESSLRTIRRVRLDRSRPRGPSEEALSARD